MALHGRALRIQCFCCWACSEPVQLLTCVHLQPSHLYTNVSLMSLPLVLPKRPPRLPYALHFKDQSGFLLASLLFPQNLQCLHAVYVLSKAISWSQVRTKLNFRKITARIRSFSIHESCPLLNLLDTCGLSFLNSIPEYAWTFFA